MLSRGVGRPKSGRLYSARWFQVTAAQVPPSIALEADGHGGGGLAACSLLQVTRLARVARVGSGPEPECSLVPKLRHLGRVARPLPACFATSVSSGGPALPDCGGDGRRWLAWTARCVILARREAAAAAGAVVLLLVLVQGRSLLTSYTDTFRGPLG